VLSRGGGYLASSLRLQTIKYLSEFPRLISILHAMGFGIATSVLSGPYPGWKASSLNPIDALRRE
jgi:putative ABC transport system permease protein